MTHVRLRHRLIDGTGRFLMRLTSRRLRREEAGWLVGPHGGRDRVGYEWVERTATEIGGHTSTGPEHGLLTSFEGLAGPAFEPAQVDPRIADFYEQTARFRLDLWSEWSVLAWPFGQLIAALLSQRLEQLCLPMRPLDVSFGMDSAVVHLHEPGGTVAGAAWLRTMRKTKQITYSGLYGVARLPGHEQPSVRVVFPLPLGSVQVFLRPSSDGNGGFRLSSPLGRFGDDGAYLVLNHPTGRLRARRIPIAEEFHLYVDDDGAVRTDHTLRLWRILAVRLHYRLQAEDRVPATGAR